MFWRWTNRFTLPHQQAYDNPEDAQNVELKKDDDVERVRRAHLNDLENIPAFLIAGLFFVCSEPQVDLALWLFRIAALARILHTIVSILIVKLKCPEKGEGQVLGNASAGDLSVINKSFVTYRVTQWLFHITNFHVNFIDFLIFVLISGVCDLPYQVRRLWAIHFICFNSRVNSRQPARAICFLTCLIITIFMVIASMVAFFKI